MPFAVWNEKYSLGIPKIDSQHQKFFEIINRIQDANLEVNAIVLNAGAYTHTSIAIGDAVRAADIPIVEVHISNIMGREDFRHVSYIAPHCVGSIIGFGIDSYRLALRYFDTN